MKGRDFWMLFTNDGVIAIREQYRLWMSRHRFTRFLYSFSLLFSKYEIMKESAALTFITMMGFIPFTVFVLLLIPELPFLQAQEQLRQVILHNFVPEAASTVSGYLDQLLTQKHALNWINFVVLLISAYSLFRIVSRTFDRVLHVRQTAPKSILYHLVQFLGTVVLGAVMILILFSASSAPILTSFFDLGALYSVVNWLLPFVFTFAFILLLFYAVPSSKTRTFSLLIGALCCTVIWMTARGLYGYYIDYFTNYRNFYGMLASVPVFIFWIYLNWAIILGGVVVIAILEDRPTEKEEDTVVTVQITVEKRYSNQTLRLNRNTAKELLRQILNEDNEPVGK
jgi:membrane protein